MRPFQLLRALFALPAALFLTLLVSLAAIAGTTLLGWPVSVLLKMVRWWGRALCAISGVTVRVEGMEHLEPGKPCIFAANHQSQFDIITLQGFLTADFRWLAKKELFRVPVWGKAMRLAGYIPIDRSHGREAIKSLAEAAQRIADGTSVVIFPEGTRSRDGRLQPFKAGAMVLAIKSGVDLVPLGINGTHQVLPKGRILARPGRVTIRIGRPIATREYDPRRKHELAERLHAAVGELLDQKDATN